MKNAIIGGIVGLLFMAGGFFYGLKLKPIPPPASPASPAPAAVAKNAVRLPPPGSPITIDLLRKTSESMMSLNEALQGREQAVAVRESKVQQREDELKAERGALDRSHAKFKELYDEFQSRLQLVEANQVAQVQRQADLYSSMGTTQSIELIRTMDDAAMIRLFSVMDTKPLGKLVAEWKTKYPEDVPRLLHNLDGMATVMPKEKIALNDSGPAADAAPTASTPPTPDSSAPIAPAAAPSDGRPASTTTPDTSAPAPAIPPDPSAAPASAAPAATDAAPQPLTPPPDSSAPPVSTAASN